MKISLNWAKALSNTDIAPNGVDGLVEKIGAQLGAVEEVIPFGERFKGLIIVKVVSCEKHPNADKLQVCKIDDGGAAQNVERDTNGLVQVVCGAPNCREGLVVVWLPPGTTVPATLGKDPLVLEARDIRGQISNGMLASARELTLSDNHDGILELDLAGMKEGAKIGDPFDEALSLKDDVVIDVENKMFTHRPDCFGILGTAREFAGIYQQAFTSPEWYLNPDTNLQAQGETLPLAIENEIPQLVPRFMAIAMKDVEIKASPPWMQANLAAAGIRPINNIVDITNYLMYTTGQPLHAYDYDKVKAASHGDPVLKARLGQPGEQLALLSGKKLTVEDNTEHQPILITTDKQPVGVGGVMGGSETEVDANTKSIIIEVAAFDMYSIRRTSMAYGIFTEAVTRYTKGQSPLQIPPVITRAVQLVQEHAGGAIASGLIDNHADLPEPARVSVGVPFINERLGLQLSGEEMAKLLRNTEFEVAVQDGGIDVTAPFWRTDIEIPEDIVEEVGRLYGYDHLPLDMPVKDITPAPQDSMLRFKQQLREILSSFGANELLTYSFVHGKLLQAAGQDPEKSFHIRNALSPELQYYRQSILPSLLEKVHPNLRADLIRTDDNEFAIFEINKVHLKGVQDPSEPEVPNEFMRLGLVFAADDKTSQRKYAGAPYYQARRFLDRLLEKLDVVPVYEPLEPSYYDEYTKAGIAPYNPDRAATVKVGDVVIGEVGEFHAKIRQALKLPKFAAGFELDVQALSHLAHPRQYLPLSRFPKVQQDINLRTPANVAYGRLNDFVADQIFGIGAEHGYYITMTTVDIYQKDPSHKQTTFRVWLSHPERTLTSEEVNNVFEKIAQAAKESLNAERV